MGRRLTALVQGCTDLPLLDYVIDNLPKGLPPQAVSSKPTSYLHQPLLAAFQRKCELLGEPYVELSKFFHQEEFAQLQRERAALSREQFQAVRALARQPVEVLRQQLRDPEPALRILAVAATDLGRRHLESDLIERLRDDHPSVRQAARRTLTRLARGTDFGPRPGASQLGVDRSINSWRQWLALQESAAPEKLAKAAAIAPAADDLLPRDRTAEDRPKLPPPAAKVYAELVNAKAGEQSSVLARLHDSEDSASIDVLALAIPQLSGDLQHQARDVLIERLTRLSAATLRDKLQDDNLEVRCAAALACGRKIVKENISDLFNLLDDPEDDVVQSARVALTELTGEDFGPSRDADPPSRTASVAAWRQWRQQQQAKKP